MNENPYQSPTTTDYERRGAEGMVAVLAEFRRRRARWNRWCKVIALSCMVIASIQIVLLMIFGSAPGENGEISVLAKLAGLSAIGLTLTGLLIAIFGPLSWHLFRRIKDPDY